MDDESELTKFLEMADEFEGINPRFYLHIQILQCQRAQLQDLSKFALAVKMLKSILADQTDEKYIAAIKEKEDNLMARQAQWRELPEYWEMRQEYYAAMFEELFRLVKRRGVSEEALSI